MHQHFAAELVREAEQTALCLFTTPASLNSLQQGKSHRGQAGPGTQKGLEAQPLHSMSYVRAVILQIL